MNQTGIIKGISNREFLEQYARPGRVGLSGGTTLVDKAIMQRSSAWKRSKKKPSGNRLAWEKLSLSQA
jgi:hypothetical protein